MAGGRDQARRAAAPACPRRAGPPAIPVLIAAGVPVLPAARLPRLLLTGGAEQQAAERRDRLRQVLHLRSQPRHPLVQRSPLRRQLLSQRLSPQRTGTPHSNVSIRSYAQGHAPQCTSPQAPRHAPNPACHNTPRPSPPVPAPRHRPTPRHRPAPRVSSRRSAPTRSPITYTERVLSACSLHDDSAS